MAPMLLYALLFLEQRFKKESSMHNGQKALRSPYSSPRLPQPKHLLFTAGFLFLVPELALASDLEGTLRNLVTAFTARILPIMAMGYLAKNIYGHVTGDPNAKLESVRVVVGIACLMGLSGVWNFIVSQAR